MATIDELMAGRAPGSIKIKDGDWDSDEWFEPYFRTENGTWYGLSEDNDSDFFFAGDEEGYVICGDENQARWLWIDNTGHITSKLYTTEEAASRPDLKRLDWSKTYQQP